MKLEDCKYYDKETGCIECKQAVVQNLAEIISWQQQKIDEIIEKCKQQQTKIEVKGKVKYKSPSKAKFAQEILEMFI